MIPELHQEATNRIVAELAKDPRIVGVAAGGSWLTGMDDYSDVDLLIGVYPDHLDAVSALPAWRDAVAAKDAAATAWFAAKQQETRR